jgi:hypothetical protein
MKKGTLKADKITCVIKTDSTTNESTSETTEETINEIVSKLKFIGEKFAYFIF